MAEYGSGEVIGPSGPLALAADGDVGPGALEEVEGKLAQGGEVFRPVVLAVADTIFIECHVQHPVQVNRTGFAGGSEP